jgi:hypothetical protein
MFKSSTLQVFLVVALRAVLGQQQQQPSAGNDKGGYSGFGSAVKGGGYGGIGGYGGAPNFDDDYFPQFSSSPPPAQQGGSHCIHKAFEVSFLFLSADLAIHPPTTDPDEIGTTFFYESSPIFNTEGFRDHYLFVKLEDSQITGVCTRTLEPVGGVGGGGGGVCQFTVQVDGISLTFGGFIADYVAGEPDPTLVISGGSGEITGITGEVALIPFDGNGDDFTGDIFFDAFGYEAIISGVTVVCEVLIESF